MGVGQRDSGEAHQKNPELRKVEFYNVVDE